MEHDSNRPESPKSDALAYYRNVIEILSQSTDDFLFLLDIKEDKNWFYGPVDKDYALRDDGASVNTSAQMLAIVHPSDKAALAEDLCQITSGEKKVHNMDYRWINKHGQVVWINCRGTVIDGDDGKPLAMIGRVSEEAMRHLFNPLTGLFNQIKLMMDLKEDILKKSRGYLMLVDIDDLSAINLGHGREYGDELLKYLAHTLESIPQARKIYHMVHNIFAVYLELESEEEARDIYASLQQRMLDKCTVSAGVIPIDKSLFIDENSVYDSAKLVLRTAKNKGRNNLEFFSGEEIRQKVYSVELLEELQESVKNGCEGFYLNYQPQVRAGSYDLFSAEALLRYRSRSGERVFPNDFIPLLEQSKLIRKVGLWVLETALLQCKEWRKSIKDMRISVNFSTVQFRDEYIVEKILTILNKTGMPGDALTVEITESISLREIEHFNDIIKHLKAAGIQIAIDDFGTGYSNIGYLKQLDVDEIKIDRMFVSGIEQDTYNYNVVNNTMDFAKMNDIRVCCEGVETPKELAVLEICAPDLIQGYLFDKPCEVEDFENAYINESSERYRERTELVQRLYDERKKMEMLRFDPRDILRENDVGLWVIRLSADGKSNELHVDDTMEWLLGLDKKCTPQECFDFWYSRIKESHKKYVGDNIHVMAHLEKVVQLQYPWIHPERGEVVVRSSGRRVKDSDGMIVLEGYHRIFSAIEEV